MSAKIVIDCPTCNVRVTAEAKEWVGDANDLAYLLVECPSCRNPMLGSSSIYRDEDSNWAWESAERLWPVPKSAEVSAAVPSAARRDIMDAQKCLTHGIYSATAVLCGKALERLIKDKVGGHMIAKGITELKTKGIIDERLYEWAEALRKERNIGAHASDEETTLENAQDIIDFTIAIFDYVYTLSEKYNLYISRKSKGEPNG